MDRLPRELIEAILHQCVAQGPKNAILRLRLVCRFFNWILKPAACCTINLDFSRMSRSSHLRRPDAFALQTVGRHCKCLYIDLMVLRDEMEVEFLETVFARVPSMTEFCHTMQKKYCMNESSFTETEYYDMVETMLFNCREVDSLRLNLPFQLVGRHCNSATRILANTLKAFASRPSADSVDLKTLVLENVTDVAICHLWMNPSDVMNIMSVVSVLQNLVMSLRRHDIEPRRAGFFRTCLWDLIEHAGHLKTLCLVGTDHDDRPPRGLKQTRSWQLPVEDWEARSLPAPRVCFSSLVCLELKRLEISPASFLAALEIFGGTLEEIYLNEVYLKTEQSSRDWINGYKKALWIGMPNQRPTEDRTWIAMALRVSCPQLRICRASFLAYDLFVHGDISVQPDFDLIDPCGLGRSVSQRFVEVATGIRQPDMPSGMRVLFFPQDRRFDPLVEELKPRTRALRVNEYDTNAHQTAVNNTTSEWQKSIDGIFHNCNSATLDELHYIAETACQGMSEIHSRGADWNVDSEVIPNVFGNG